MNGTTFLQILLLILLTITGQTFIKRGLMRIGEIKIGDFHKWGYIFLNLVQNKYIIAGVFLSLLGTLIWFVVMSKTNLTVAAPIVGGFFYIFLFLFSWLFLGENITLWRVIGTIIILIGIWVLSFR